MTTITNFEWIKAMSVDQMADFICISRPSCNEICKDARSGCAFDCKYSCGEDVVRRWLDLDIIDGRKI